ncbi:MAG: CHAT domain-containing protein [Rhodoplanes sp.]|uniref:CHAT domain-containing tetratricopeptide repeat protein n=1 Tax=Rhodoplanes sp. TaxID=1968906 RepID=UPI00181A086C|nr:CHAT domain-containing tetratricopeptide repeat protein [Rhodoplanes sp.]NVO13561.1 CHAT domain-containing protein [Rhodoplanes sp.]
MTHRNRLALMICVALAAGTGSADRVSAEGLGAQSARINALGGAGKYAEAIPLAEAMLASLEKGPPTKDLAGATNNLAQLYGAVGRDAEAEPLFKRAIAIMEKAVGLDSVEIAPELNNLAALYQRQQRYADAEPLFRRVLALSEKQLPSTHPDRGRALNNLATNFERQDRHSESEPLFRRALALYEKVAGPENPAVATVLNNLGQVVKAEGRYDEAAPLIRRSLAIREKVLGKTHPDVARSLNNLADLFQRKGRFADAEPLFKRSLAIRDATVGPDHPDTAAAVDNLASLYLAEGRIADALPLEERLIAVGRAQTRIALPVLFGAQQLGMMPRETALDAALDVIQRSTRSSAASAVDKLAVRLAAGTDRLAELVRKDQDLASEAEQLDKAIIAGLSRQAGRDPAVAQRGRERLAVVARERAALQKTLAVEFPDYAALSNPLSLKQREVQTLLSGDEAMVLFALGDKESFVIALTRDNVDWQTVPLGAGAVTEKVVAFRRGLDLGRTSDASGNSQPFDLALANELYAALIGPVETLVAGKRSLLIAPAGVLTALPFHLLVTSMSPAAVPEAIEGYRAADWLLKRHAVSVLPSVGSLKALRGYAQRDRAPKPMTGFGDPLFDPSDLGRENRFATRSVPVIAYTDFWKGAGVDRARLAEALPQLPETADELTAVARDLAASVSDIHLGVDASETTVKRLALTDYRVVYFATHGLVAGDVKGVAEPSLALSIPPQPSAFDDGLLTASEVAQLKLNADWVVLSACNTIAGDKPGAEALSGLARTFFYAGARALLVTHWAVDSEAAARLTTSTFDLLKAEPAIGRAEALRRAMLGLLNDSSSSKYAYPAFWGSFALIGEGAVR